MTQKSFLQLLIVKFISLIKAMKVIFKPVEEVEGDKENQVSLFVWSNNISLLTYINTNFYTQIRFEVIYNMSLTRLQKEEKNLSVIVSNI